MHRSHLTQEMQNYFDEKDVRTREMPWTLEAQLLNAAACSLEESQVRVGREIDARFRDRVPLNIDNGGNWYRVQLPAGVASVSKVEGKRDGFWRELPVYDDLLPVPAGIEFDGRRTAVRLADPVLFTFIGTGLPQVVSGFPMPVPNRLHFWLEGADEGYVPATVVIEGCSHPRPFGSRSEAGAAELVVLEDAGPAATRRTWDEITRITVRGLPAGVSLKCCLFPFAFPVDADPMRPYVHPAYRDARFRRGWRAEGNVVREVYFANRWTGWEHVFSYAASGVTSLAVEPNTYGLLAASGRNLLYADRREPAPDNLYRTAISEEPLYGLDASYDIVRSVGGSHVVCLRPVPYAGAPGLVGYRLIAQEPSGALWIVMPEGGMAPYRPTDGWLRGRPAEIALDLGSKTGTWFFTLQSSDQRGHRTEDRVPYVHAAFSPKAVLDTSALVPSLSAAGFDSRQRLWLWSGSFLVPARFRYDACVIEEEDRAVYLTDSFEEVRLS